MVAARWRWFVVAAGLAVIIAIAWAMYFPPPWFLRPSYYRWRYQVGSVQGVRSVAILSLAEWESDPNNLLLRVRLDRGGYLEMVVSGDDSAYVVGELTIVRIDSLAVFCRDGSLHPPSVRAVGRSDLGALGGISVAALLLRHDELLRLASSWQKREAESSASDIGCSAVFVRPEHAADGQGG